MSEDQLQEEIQQALGDDFTVCAATAPFPAVQAVQ